MGDVMASSGTEFITNDWPSGETIYWCRLLFEALLPTLVANNGRGGPGSTLTPSDENPSGTAINRSSAAHE